LVFQLVQHFKIGHLFDDKTLKNNTVLLYWPDTADVTAIATILGFCFYLTNLCLHHRIYYPSVHSAVLSKAVNYFFIFTQFDFLFV